MAHYSSLNYTVVKIKRSELQPGDEILGPAPPYRDLVRLPRPSYRRRTSSLDRDDFSARYRDKGTIARRRTTPYPQDQYDSEGPIPPRYRDRATISGGRPRARAQPDLRDQYSSEGSIPPRSRTTGTAKQKQKQKLHQTDHDPNPSSSASSSDLGRTSDDEKIKKKAKLKKWGAIGLAGVATIHAVHGVHETVQKTAARHKELAEGQINEEQAHKKKSNSRWKTAADVGIAAVWIKSAYDEIKEYREARKEHSEACERSEERHRKRLERAKVGKKGEYNGRYDLDDQERRKYSWDADDDDGDDDED